MLDNGPCERLKPKGIWRRGFCNSVWGLLTNAALRIDVSTHRSAAIHGLSWTSRVPTQ
jgi:hypothetical protein